ncbi:M23 family metallopeptidase [Ferroacidibacillus organovorans]|nr:M23 family metallopeptidase [Ferroacidibacillus organovorans]
MEDKRPEEMLHVRPEYSISPDDDVYGSPRSWTGAQLPVRRESREQENRRRENVRERSYSRGLNDRRSTQKQHGMSLFVLQSIGAVFLIVSIAILSHSNRNFAVSSTAFLRQSLTYQDLAQHLPSRIAQWLGVPPTASPSVGVVSQTVDVVPPLRGTLVRPFSMLNPDIIIRGHRGSPIIAAAEGLVTQVGESAANGWYVTIDHGAMGQTFYAKMARVVVKPREYVTVGETIGYLPEQSPELTFGYIHNGRYENPATLIGLHA